MSHLDIHPDPLPALWRWIGRGLLVAIGVVIGRAL